MTMSTILKCFSRGYATTAPRATDSLQNIYISALKSYKPKATPAAAAVEAKEWVMPAAPTAPNYDLDFSSALDSYKYDGQTIEAKTSQQGESLDFMEKYTKDEAPSAAEH
ncbi:F1-ATPase subunit H [Schizosaccharomyces cryophilus OY26]|uniref:F1-ATPase subunit H n=1 Tax=Schizosaccharomyces cryophilus (strain OY26 / ATCC MYA-4695 / CBS 11777 / NBRC 106824 / NRRL Y48691) TaxID=653667 RepID=S9VU45_SCHCR|nr:F1-ATPase subunit H [Schizosaccharomyces cryophilus OY26]EPY49630.1 F1-ATPase subunit H [Schizosaccharomyces cryophilus OY26]